MLNALSIALVVAAAIAGATGTWSPCGLSMIDTLCPRGHGGGRATTASACLTFSLGAPLGGAFTFGLLGLLGALLPLGDPAGPLVAACLALAAAAGEARGARIVPQIRRQVPEPWRRRMPLPLAAGLYGVLLGLGFTTFVLTFAVWALAGISFVLGDPALGLGVGLAFGIGRALPVIVLAPLADSVAGIRACELMAERPALLRRVRLADGLALLACASVLSTATASARQRVGLGTDPSAAGPALAWQVPGASGMLLAAGAAPAPLPGTDPALGGPYLAYRNQDLVTVAQAASGAIVRQLNVSGVEKLAVSDGWLAARVRGPHVARILAWPLAAPEHVRVVARSGATSALSRPALDGDRLVFSIAGRFGATIVEQDLARGRRRVLRRSRSRQLLNPSLLGSRLLYVATSYCAQRLMLGPLRRGRDRVLLDIASTARRDRGYEPGHTSQGSEPARCPRGLRPPSRLLLWTTALGAGAAYVTEVPLNAPTTATIVRLSRR